MTTEDPNMFSESAFLIFSLVDDFLVPNLVQYISIKLWYKVYKHFGASFNLPSYWYCAFREILMMMLKMKCCVYQMFWSNRTQYEEIKVSQSHHAGVGVRNTTLFCIFIIWITRNVKTTTRACD